MGAGGGGRVHQVFSNLLKDANGQNNAQLVLTLSDAATKAGVEIDRYQLVSMR